MNNVELYKAILKVYKNKYPIKIDSNHTSSGTVYDIKKNPNVVLREEDPMVLAHELGHIENNKATQKLIDLMGWTANTTGWNWLMGKATLAKERLANKHGLRILREHNADPEYLKEAEQGYCSPTVITVSGWPDERS